jgi:hypothetical protein
MPRAAGVVAGGRGREDVGRGEVWGAAHGAAAGRVVEIDLIGKGLTGSVPAALGQLAALKWLILDDNQLTGSVPAALGQLVALQLLHLNNNQLTGSVPAALGQLAALRYLTLDNNQLTCFPAALVQQLRDRGVDVSLDDGVARV